MVSPWRNAQMGIAGISFVIVCILGAADGVLAGDDKTKESAGIVDQVGTALKNTATKIEQEMSGVVKKFEESETPKKVGNEFKRSAEYLGQKVEEAGKKLRESFKSE
jgi:gas vesicle protein